MYQNIFQIMHQTTLIAYQNILAKLEN